MFSGQLKKGKIILAKYCQLKKRDKKEKERKNKTKLLLTHYCHPKTKYCWWPVTGNQKKVERK